MSDQKITRYRKGTGAGSNQQRSQIIRQFYYVVGEGTGVGVGVIGGVGVASGPIVYLP